MADIADTLAQAHRALFSHYGDRLERVVLYGSYARHSADPESDIDLLVILRGPFDYVAELGAIVDVLEAIQAGCGCLISAKPAALEEYEAGRLQLYRNAKREGVTV